MGQIRSEKAKILFVGDSHSVVSFGDAFREQFNQALSAKYEFYQFAVSGSRIADWLNDSIKQYKIRNLEAQPGERPTKSEAPTTKDLLELVHYLRPEQLIVALGTNDIISIAKNEMQWSELKMALLKIAEFNLKFVFILPPNLNYKIVDKSFYKLFQEMITTIFPQAHLIQSDSFTPDQVDGVHFLRESGLRWGQNAWEQYKNLALNA